MVEEASKQMQIQGYKVSLASFLIIKNVQQSVDMTNQEIELHKKYLQNIQKKKRYNQVIGEGELNMRTKASSTKLPYVNGSSLGNQGTNLIQTASKNKKEQRGRSNQTSQAEQTNGNALGRDHSKFGKYVDRKSREVVSSDLPENAATVLSQSGTAPGRKRKGKKSSTVPSASIAVALASAQLQQNQQQKRFSSKNDLKVAANVYFSANAQAPSQLSANQKQGNDKLLKKVSQPEITEAVTKKRNSTRQMNGSKKSGRANKPTPYTEKQVLTQMQYLPAVEFNKDEKQVEQVNSVLKQHMPKKNPNFNAGVLGQSSMKTGDTSKLSFIGNKSQENKSSSVRIPQKQLKDGNIVTIQQVNLTPIRNKPVMGIGNQVVLNSADSAFDGKGRSLPRNFNEKVHLRQNYQQHPVYNNGSPQSIKNVIKGQEQNEYYLDSKIIHRQTNSEGHTDIRVHSQFVNGQISQASVGKKTMNSEVAAIQIDVVDEGLGQPAIIHKTQIPNKGEVHVKVGSSRNSPTIKGTNSLDIQNTPSRLKREEERITPIPQTFGQNKANTFSNTNSRFNLENGNTVISVKNATIGQSQTDAANQLLSSLQHSQATTYNFINKGTIATQKQFKNDNILRETHSVMTKPLDASEQKYLGQKVNSTVVEMPRDQLLISSLPDDAVLHTQNETLSSHHGYRDTASLNDRSPGTHSKIDFDASPELKNNNKLRSMSKETSVSQIPGHQFAVNLQQPRPLELQKPSGRKHAGAPYVKDICNSSNELNNYYKNSTVTPQQQHATKATAVVNELNNIIARSQQKSMLKSKDPLHNSFKKKKDLKPRARLGNGSKIQGYSGLIQHELLNDMSHDQQKLFKIQVDKANKYEIDRRQRMRDVAQGKNAPLIGVKGFHVVPSLSPSPLKEHDKKDDTVKAGSFFVSPNPNEQIELANDQVSNMPLEAEQSHAKTTKLNSTQRTTSATKSHRPSSRPVSTGRTSKGPIVIARAHPQMKAVMVHEAKIKMPGRTLSKPAQGGPMQLAAIPGANANQPQRAIILAPQSLSQSKSFAGRMALKDIGKNQVFTNNRRSSQNPTGYLDKQKLKQPAVGVNNQSVSVVKAEIGIKPQNTASQNSITYPVLTQKSREDDTKSSGLVGQGSQKDLKSSGSKPLLQSPTKLTEKVQSEEAPVIEPQISLVDESVDQPQTIDPPDTAETNNQSNTGPIQQRATTIVLNPEVARKAEQERILLKKLEALERAKNYSKLNKGVNKFKFVLVTGNNSAVVRKCMALRADRWEETNHFDKLYNFKWQPTSRGLNFNLNNQLGTRQLVNHIGNHGSITTKDKLFESMFAFCEEKRKDVFKYLPLTFVLQTDSAFFTQEIDKFSQYFTFIQQSLQTHQNNSDTVLQEVNKEFGKKMKVQLPKKAAVVDSKGRILKQTSRMEIPQAYFKGHNMWILKVTGQNRGIGIHVFNKLGDLSRYIRKYTKQLPSSDILDKAMRSIDTQALDIQKFSGPQTQEISHLRDISPILQSRNTPSNAGIQASVYVHTPSKLVTIVSTSAQPNYAVEIKTENEPIVEESLATQESIEEESPLKPEIASVTKVDQHTPAYKEQVFMNPVALSSTAAKKDAGGGVKSSGFVIQKYMEDPLLIHKRKFDIRVWVLVTHDGKCFLFKEGYIRTSCEEYDTSNAEAITNPEIHLTNNAIQQKLTNFGKYEEANQMTFAQLQTYLNEFEAETPEVQGCVTGKIYDDMREQIIISLEASKNQLKLEKGSFELFGYDFLIDNNLGTWLVEVNTNPCFDEPSSLLKQFIPRMINDALKLTIDVCFGARKGMTPYKPQDLNVFPVDGYDLHENMWESILQLPVRTMQANQVIE